MSTLRALAEQVLFGDRMEDKLTTLAGLSDNKPGTPLACSPDSPGRPRGLELNRGRRAGFPRSFASCRARGEALHFFANHELLAIELMALCLLRFPEAPKAFRRGVANIIAEEQSHLRLYIDGAEKLGVSLGELPVNAFFWDALRGMESPLEFVAGMGLTFEQANLDHCRRFIGLFREAGDTESATLLEKVYEDEIRHVRHGLRWFRSWKEPDRSDFQAHRDALRHPLTIARAKARPFDLEGRRNLGMDADYIRSLQLYSHSAGRPPDVFVFNPGCEYEIAHPGRQPPKAAKQRAAWLELLPMFLAKRDDVLLVGGMPPAAHLERLQALGFALPQLALWPAEKESLSGRILGELRPWGWSPEMARNLSALGAAWEGRERGVYGKSWSADLLRKWTEEVQDPWMGPEEAAGRSCRDRQEVDEQIRRLHALGYEEVLLKAELSTAGRGNSRLKGSMKPNQERWLEKQISSQGSVVVEPMLDRAIDYSIQLTVSKDGKVRRDGHGRFFTDANGQYLGHRLGGFAQGMPQTILRFLHGDGNQPGRWRALLEESAQRVGTALAESGYSGPAGIDAMIYRRKGKLLIRPVVEVNPRQTMGRIALALEKKTRGQGLLLFLPGRQAEGLASELQARRQDSQLVSGLVPITPTSNPVSACLVAGRETVENLLPILPPAFREGRNG
jgi:uncharacterized ferritin-like protein (DUF455 family)